MIMNLESFPVRTKYQGEKTLFSDAFVVVKQIN